MYVVSLAPINSLTHALVVFVVEFIGCVPEFGGQGVSTLPMRVIVIASEQYGPCPCRGGSLCELRCCGALAALW